MTDKEIADQLYKDHYATEMPKISFYKQLGIDVPESSYAEIIGRDLPLAGAQGVVGLYEGVKGLTGFVPLSKGKIPKAIESAEKSVFGGSASDLQQYLESLKSEGQQMVSQGAAEIPSTGNLLRDATGQLIYAGQNPQQIGQIVAQSLPSTYGGALIGRGISATGAKFGKDITPITAAASGEGTLAAGSGLESVRQQTENKEVTTPQQLITAFSGYMTNKLGRLGNRAAKYLGVDDMDVILVRGNMGSTPAANQKAQSKLVAGLKSALSESVFEELPQSTQEQISQNIALGRPYDEGVAEQMAAGIIGGAGAGFGFGTYNQYKVNKALDNMPPPPTDVDAEPPGIDIEVPKTDTKKNAKTRKDLIDSIEDAETKKSLEELLGKKGKPSGTQQTTAGTSDEVSGGSDDGTTGGTKKPVGGGVDGAATDELTDKTGEGRSDVALETITTNDVGKPFPSTGQAHKFRRDNKLENLYSVITQADGTIALVPKIPVTEQKPLVTKTKKPAVTKEPEVAAEETEEDIPDEEIGWEKFEETKPDGTITSGFRRKQTTTQKDAPVVISAKTPKSTEVLKSEAELTEADKADLEQEEADEEAASQARIDEANQGGFEDLPDYVKIGSKLASKSPIVQAEESDPNASTESKRQEARRLAVKHAAFDQAMDEFDTVSTEDFDAKLKELANEKMEELKKEMRDKGATEEEINNKLSTKKFSINKPLEFIKGSTQAQRFSNYYKEFNKFLGTKKLKPRRIKQATTREEFTETLSKQERKLFNKAYSSYITTQVKSLKSGVASVDETESNEAALYRKLQDEIELVKKKKGSQAKVDKYKADYAIARAKAQKTSLSRQVVETDTSALSDKVANLEQAIKDGENEIKSIKAAKKIKDKAVQIKGVQTQINKDRVELKLAKTELDTAQKTTTVLGAPGRYTNISTEETRATEILTKQNKKNKKKEKAIQEGNPEEVLEVLDDETEELAKSIIVQDKKKTEEEAKEKAKKQPKITVVGKLNMIVSKSITQGKNIIETLDDLYDSKNKEKARSYQRTALLFSEVLSKLQNKGYDLPKVVFGPVPNDRPGMYNPETNTITINDTSEVEYGRVLVHETLHYLLDHIVEEYQKSPNSNLLSPSQKVYLGALLESYNYARQNAASLVEKNKFDASLKDFAEEIKTMEFKEFLAEAVEGMQFSIALGKLEPMPGRVLPFLRQLARDIAGMLGFRLEHRLPTTKDKPVQAFILEAVLNDIESILTGEDYVAPNPLFRSGDVSFARKIDLSEDAEEASKAERSFDDLVDNDKSTMLERGVKSTVQKMTETFSSGQNFIDEVATTFSNERFVLERLQENMDRSGAISYAEDSFNNFYDYISTAFGKAQWYLKQKIENPRKTYIITLSNIANAKGVSNSKAATILKYYAIAFHAPERRKTKWLLNVPLEKLNKIKFKSTLFGTVEDTPANIRERFFDTISSDVIAKLSEEQRKYIAESLKNDLIRLVNTKGAITATGYSPAGYKKTNITEADYNVIEDLSFNDEQVCKNKYMAESSEMRTLVQQFFAAKKQLQDATTELNRMAGYWSNATDAIVEFYGWKNYSPFKVRPGDRAAFKLNIEGTALGRTGKDYPGSRFEGSSADVENPVNQVLVEAAQSAARAGADGLMRSIINAVNQGYLKGVLIDGKGNARKKTELNKPTYTFQERYTGKVDEAILKRPDILYAYNKDGSMDLVKITDLKQLEAIRRTYSINNESIINSAVQFLNKGTSAMGQGHTRLNPGFAPYNFVRDILTNVGIVSMKENPLVGARIISAVVTEIIAKGGIAKAARFSFLFHNNRLDDIEKLAEKDGFYKSLSEYGKKGGNVSVVQGLSAASAMEMLSKELDKSLTLRSKDDILKYFDMYNSMFEFGARVAVYRVMKRHFQDQMSKELNALPSQVEQAAIFKAVAYTKNLANFEERGLYTKQLGTYFMFFGAGAVGARQALKALSPAWRKYEAVANTLPENIQKDPVKMAKFKKRFTEQKFWSRTVAAAMIGIGYSLWQLMHLMAGLDDDDKDQEGRNKIATDDSRRWTRNARIYLGYDEKTHKDVMGNIPWGFGPNAFMAFGAQIAAYTSGEGVELKDFAVNTMHIAMDSYLPIPTTGIDPTDNTTAFLVDMITPSIAKPLNQFAMNRNSLDQQIYRSSYNKYSSAYSGNDSIPRYFKDASEWAFEVSDGKVVMSPDAMYFYANNYADGISKIVESLYGGISVLKGDKYFDLEKDAFIFDSFLNTTSNLDARRFDTLKNNLTEKSKIYEDMKLRNPQQAYKYANIINPNLEVKLKVLNYFNNKALKPVETGANQVRNNTLLNSKEKSTLLYRNRLEKNHIKKGVYDTIKSIDDLGKAELNGLLEMIAEDEAAMDLRNAPDSNP